MDLSSVSLLQFSDKFCEIGRQITLEIQFLTGDGMNKSNTLGVEALTIQILANLRLFFSAIHRITGHRMTDVGHMHTNLVGASGLQF